MGRLRNDYTSDEARLPEGLERIGYDADDQVYTFRDAVSGEVWEGEPGNEFGKLHRVVDDVASSPLFESDRSRQFVYDPLKQLPDAWVEGPASNIKTSGPENEKGPGSPRSKWQRAFQKLRRLSIRDSISSPEEMKSPSSHSTVLGSPVSETAEKEKNTNDQFEKFDVKFEQKTDGQTDEKIERESSSPKV